MATPNTQQTIPPFAPLLARCDSPELAKVAEAARQLFDECAITTATKSGALGAANILLDYGMDAAAVCAVLLQALQKTDSSAIAAQYGDDVATLVRAVLKTREVPQIRVAIAVEATIPPTPYGS